VAGAEESDGLLPGGSTQELVQPGVLLGEVEHLRELLVDELRQLGLELVVWAEESEAHLLDEGEALEHRIFE
jgi:hypothetical protein